MGPRGVDCYNRGLREDRTLESATENNTAGYYNQVTCKGENVR